MQEGYQIIEIKNRVSDVLTQMSIKVSNVLTVLGQRCADSYQIMIKKRENNATILYYKAMLMLTIP
jgi:antitoxin component of RelBE/YafQ-DinJ toxin-antitoxin module